MLIKKAYKKYNQKVVVLIDEYDKPILDNITKKDMRDYAKEQIKAFYSILKTNDEYIRFAFLTGVSKFSKVSIFSGLNNIRDISLNPNFGNICGYTHEDIQTTFRPLLNGVDLEELKGWYNGYNFLKDYVYNPYDILLFCDSQHVFENYWFSTGTPTFLINLIKEKNYYLPNLENLTVGSEILDSFDMDNINLEVLLYQAGYLTINKALQNPFGGYSYSLKIPNKEVKLSFNSAILNALTDNPTKRLQSQSDTYLALQSANLEKFEASLKTLFSSLPYHNFTKNNIQIYEGFYASVIYSFLSSLGLKQIGEDVTSEGRIDLTLFIEDKVYILEFKTDASSALKQIKEKNYHEKYLHVNKEVYLVGISFDTKKRNVSRFEWEKISY